MAQFPDSKLSRAWESTIQKQRPGVYTYWTGGGTRCCGGVGMSANMPPLPWLRGLRSTTASPPEFVERESDERSV